METIKEALLNALGDYSLRSLSWTDNGTLVICVDIERNNYSINWRLECSYFQNLLIDFDFGDLCNSPLMWGSDYSIDEEGRHKLTLDFRGSSNGVIQLDADDIVVTGGRVELP